MLRVDEPVNVIAAFFVALLGALVWLDVPLPDWSRVGIGIGALMLAIGFFGYALSERRT